MSENKKRLILLGVSLVVTVLLLEGGLRLMNPYGTFGAGVELPWMRGNLEDLSRIYTVDPEFGFRPILGNSIYSRFGTLANGYSEDKPAGKTRLLFIGDSVTARGRIVGALKKLYGPDDYEYWNAGVESFTTAQEVKYYLKYNRLIRPDHVILTFHVNDFETTPIAYWNDQGKLVVYYPNRPQKSVNPWLYSHSALYRFVLGALLDKRGGREAIEAEVKQGLARLKQELDQEGVRFSVIVHPILKPRAEWDESFIQAHDKGLAMLDELGIRRFDLLDPLKQGLESGLELWEAKNDPMHPGTEAARIFAEDLHARGLLDKAK